VHSTHAQKRREKCEHASLASNWRDPSQQSETERRTEPEDDLLGGLGLLVEDGLGLTSVTGLLSVVTPLSLGEDRVLTLLVLGHLVRGVLLASLALAVGSYITRKTKKADGEGRGGIKGERGVLPKVWRTTGKVEGLRDDPVEDVLTVWEGKRATGDCRWEA
jgi:hypothetical protein